MNRNKRRYMRATLKSVKLSTRAEYWAWKAKLAHAAEVENAVETTLNDALDFAKDSSDFPGSPIDFFTGRATGKGVADDESQ
jgi:hypothetical protein